MRLYYLTKANKCYFDRIVKYSKYGLHSKQVTEKKFPRNQRNIYRSVVHYDVNPGQHVIADIPIPQLSNLFSIHTVDLVKTFNFLQFLKMMVPYLDYYFWCIVRFIFMNTFRFLTVIVHFYS